MNAEFTAQASRHVGYCTALRERAATLAELCGEGDTDDPGFAMAIATDYIRGQAEQLAEARAEIDRLKADLRFAKAWEDVLRRQQAAALPCGHLERYAYSEDGFKTGHCLVCRARKAEEEHPDVG
jgi:hypothetical protein